MGLADEMRDFAAKTKARIDATVRTVVLEVDRSLVEKSPVGDPLLWARPGNAPPGYIGGRFRANWQYGENEIPEGELFTPIVGPFPSAAESIETVAAQIKPDAGGKIHYLVNNLPYAQALEDGHSSKQAPAGVVGITVIEFEQIIEAAVQKL
jgi:hypothetical protein